MDLLEAKGAPDLVDLQELGLDDLASDAEAARLAARLTRIDDKDEEGSDPVRVAAFNSYI
ncbi:hypothetical protein [Actinomadura nitritigenes]|uniref:FXSXX-COOH protein n=1 Tax=Actinomadura nitritigenes TaxID=134602 RepID=A0ABS3QRG0_9ACTN|nr:hypothetical protein [Actinomadura nitritigenes]MBO2436579.1 hypothetical protein [Actinomadura nitritigenes]